MKHYTANHYEGMMETYPEEWDDNDMDTEDIKKKTDQRDVDYVGRLKRRSNLLADMRNAYLRDVIAVRHLIEDMLSDDERSKLIKQICETIPSLDLNQHLKLHSPSNTSMNLIPCESCGGSVEFLIHDSPEILKLSEQINHMNRNKAELRVVIATKNTELEDLQTKLAENAAKHRAEKNVLFAEIKEVKSQIDILRKSNEQLVFANHTYKTENADLKLLTTDATELRQSLLEVEAERDHLRRELTEACAMQQKYNDQVISLNGDMEAMVHRHDSISQQLEQAKEDVKVTKEALKSQEKHTLTFQKKSMQLESRLETSKMLTETLQKEKAGLSEELRLLNESTTAEIGDLKRTIEELHGAQEELEGEMTSVKETLQNKCDEIDVLRQEISESLTQYEEYSSVTERTMSDLRSGIAARQQRVDDLESESKDLRNVNVELELRVEQLQKQVSEVTMHSQALQERVEDSENKVMELVGEVAKKEEVIKSLEETALGIRGELEEAKTKIEQLEKEAEENAKNSRSRLSSRTALRSMSTASRSNSRVTTLSRAGVEDTVEGDNFSTEDNRTKRRSIRPIIRGARSVRTETDDAEMGKDVDVESGKSRSSFVSRRSRSITRSPICTSPTLSRSPSSSRSLTKQSDKSTEEVEVEAGTIADNVADWESPDDSPDKKGNGTGRYPEPSIEHGSNDTVIHSSPTSVDINESEVKLPARNRRAPVLRHSHSTPQRSINRSRNARRLPKSHSSIASSETLPFTDDSSRSDGCVISGSENCYASSTSPENSNPSMPFIDEEVSREGMLCPEEIPVSSEKRSAIVPSGISGDNEGEKQIPATSSNDEVCNDRKQVASGDSDKSMANTVTLLTEQLSEANIKVQKLSNNLHEANQKVVELERNTSRLEELSERNKSMSIYISDLDARHRDLQEDYEKVCDELKNVSAENEHRMLRIESLETALSIERVEHEAAVCSLDHMRALEKSRLEGLVNCNVQTEPLVSDSGVQTDFFVPPISLRHRLASEAPRSAGSPVKNACFPTVTPGSAGGGIVGSALSLESMEKGWDSLNDSGFNSPASSAGSATSTPTLPSIKPASREQRSSSLSPQKTNSKAHTRKTLVLRSLSRDYCAPSESLREHEGSDLSTDTDISMTVLDLN